MLYLAILIHNPVPNDSIEFCILSRTDVTATAETCVGSLCCKCYRFPPNKTHLERGNYYVDKLVLLLCSNCLRIAIILTFNTLTDNGVGSSCVKSFKRTGNENYLRAI